MLTNLFNLTRPLILFDLETTGTDPNTARVCSLGMIVYRPGEEPRPYRTLVNPLVSIPEGAAETHGITDETIATGCAACWSPETAHPVSICDKFRPVPKFSDLAPRLITGFRDSDFAGYNIKSYDLKVLAAEFARLNVEFDYSKAAIIDGLRLWQLFEPRTLTDFVKRFAKRELEGAHDAMNDVMGTLDGLVGFFEEAQNLPRDVYKLHDLQWPRDPNALDSEGKFILIGGVPCFNFGKWKGQPVKSQPGYLQWMVTSGGFIPEVKRLAEQFYNGDYSVPQK